MIKFTAFRTIDNIELAEKFAIGHENVLTSYGIKKVTSSNRSWMKNPFSYAILVTDNETGEAVGGARIHVSDNKYPLPMEDAVGDIDSNIHNLIANYSYQKSGEICAVWNSRDLSGTGLSIILLRACIAESFMAIAKQLDLSTLFAFCAPWTVKMFSDVGYEIEKSVGKSGTYLYPTPELLATVMIMKDPKNLSKVLKTEKEKIINLRKKPQQLKVEAGKKDAFLVEYDLVIENFTVSNKLNAHENMTYSV